MKKAHGERETQHFRDSQGLASCTMSGSLFICVAFLAASVSGKPFEVETTSYRVELSTHGVEVEVCKRLVYEVKGCRDHGLVLQDGEGTDLMFVVLAGWYNTRSRLNVYPTERFAVKTISNLLHCDEFRWFWISWDEGRIKYGKGKVPGQNAVLDLEDPTGILVKKMTLRKVNGVMVNIRLGDLEGGRFARVLEEGKFSDGLISETSTSRGSCASLCSEHVNCGMFSYSSDHGLCAIFDRMTSSFNVTSEEGWTSWKMLYCYP